MVFDRPARLRIRGLRQQLPFMASTKSSDKKSVFDVDESSMRVNKVDQVSSLLSSLLILVGLAVLMLGLLFFLRSGTSTIDVIALEPERIAGRGDNAPGFERDFDPPAADEVEQLKEPAMEQTLQLVSEAINNISTVMESLDALESSKSGRGDSRPPGTEGEGDDIVPRPERWDIKFQSRDKRGYGAQLDFFKIELGVYGGTTPVVDYLAGLSSGPTKRSGPAKADKRLYFLSVADGVLKQYDKQFLQGASIDISNRSIMKFFPKETEDLLAQAEARYYTEKRNPQFRVTDVAKTVFEVKPAKSGKGFEFVVVDQRYRNKGVK
jgi:hypothetical protein